MSTRQKLLIAVLPLIIALTLITGSFLLASGSGKISEKRLNTAASSLSELIIKGNSVKDQGAGHPKYVLFFGSSELRRFDPFHPSVLAEKYQRGYRPFLLGTAGTQSLIHFLSLHSMADGIAGQRAVFIISPQWFQRRGIGEGSFDEFFSLMQVYDWICKNDTDAASRVYFAERMLDFKIIRKNSFLRGVLEKIAEGGKPRPAEIMRCQNQLRLLNTEDHIFGKFFVESHRRAIRTYMKKLPDTYDADQLDALAFQVGEQASGNNAFQIQNRYYTNRIQPRLDFFKGRQKAVSYDKSPEYGDFQLVLSEIAKDGMDVLFVIPPVNKRWAEYVGLRKDMYLRFEAKIKEQLTAQGFDRILDLSRRGGDSYFMQDPTHLGWRGWVAIDRAVQPFLEGADGDRAAPAYPEGADGNRAAPAYPEGADGNRAAPVYRIDPYYFSDEWCSIVPPEMP
ncbi:MAG: D-alanyl-lipoteichoic acid biosynthesis protein DltD [Clostridiales Family XIII bacterium]|jgi:D-alanine transfer protein|nr:D-alanyl-lipoteichoic acid biosynthesis protein DltD [Clostridiales Family XIII bacterium]